MTIVADSSPSAQYREGDVGCGSRGCPSVRVLGARPGRPSTWTVRRSRRPGRGSRVRARRTLAGDGSAAPAEPRGAAIERMNSPSYRNTVADQAPHNRSALSAMPRTPAARPSAARLMARRMSRSRSAAPATRSGPVPRLQLSEQARVLDRDHRLVGEGLDQGDLLVGEWPDLRAGVLITPRACPRAAGAPRASCGAAVLRARLGELGVGCEVREHGVVRVEDRRPADRARSAARTAPQNGGPARLVRGDEAEHVAVAPADRRRTRAQRRAAFCDDRVEHGLDIGRRRLITRRISAVAVCCSSASVSSRLRAPAPGTGARSRWRSPPGRRRSGAARSASR